PAAAPPTAAQAAPTSAPAVVSAKGTVKFWHVWGGDRQPIMEKVIANFQQQNPDIKIEHTVLSQQGLYEKYLTAIAGGDPPEVMMIHSRQMPAFADKGSLNPVADLVTRDQLDLESIFYRADVRFHQWDGTQIGMPQTSSGGWYLLFWNKAHFKEAGLDPDTAPKTWSEYFDYAKALTKKSGDTIQRVGALFWYLDNNHWMEYTFANGGHLYSDDGKKVLYDSEAALAALQYEKESLDQLYGGYEKVRSFGTQPGAGGGEANQSFFNGQLSMHVNGQWHFLQLSKEAPDLDYGVGLFPYNDKNPDAKSLQFSDGGWGFYIPKGAKNVDAAWEWIKYTTMGEGQKDFFLAQGRPTVVPEFNQDPKYLEVNPHWPVLQEALNTTTFSPVNPEYPQARKIIDQFTEEALVGKRTPEDAVKWGTEQVQKIYDEYYNQ
ncbi:MAG TPA: hypothetical protein DEP84_28930, partial [Chloroflexi bacterium]|nr:hypothetical protein [Chloroflexota bacterium]